MGRKPTVGKADQPVLVHSHYTVAWKNGDKVIGEVLERRPLKQFRIGGGLSLGSSSSGSGSGSGSGVSSSSSVAADLAELGPSDFEYYVHFPKFDRRLDEWVAYERIDTKGGPINENGMIEHGLDKKHRLKRSRSELEAALTAGERGAGHSGHGHGGHGGHGGSGNGAAAPASGEQDPRAKLHALERETEEITKVKNLSTINLGKYNMQAWYYSPYPDDYCGELIHICEYCLTYMKSRKTLVKHLARKCKMRNPPGKLIYHEKDVHPAVAMYEIDGAVERLYCQNLCLLSKVFLDHKTLYYDTEPFLFYVLCEVDNEGAHVVGYFSKEKHSQEGYNLACSLTFPSHQRKGYGKLLISISYELTKRENVTGSPEKPLSDLGKISYRSYWAFVILKNLEEAKRDGKNVIVQDISRSTGIRYEDVTSTLHSLNLIKAWKGQHVVFLKANYIESQRLQQKKIRLCNPLCLTWEPPPKDHTHATGGRR